MTFNKISRVAHERAKTDKVTPLLRDIDRALMIKDGRAYYGYTGRGWVCWMDDIILGYGWTLVNPAWFEGYCRFVNNAPDDYQGTYFVELKPGVYPSDLGVVEFYKWLQKEAKYVSFQREESKSELYEELQEFIKNYKA